MPSRRLLAGAVAALFGFTACQLSKPSQILPATVKPSQVLRVAVPALPASTDPALTPPYDSGVARTAFEALLKPNPTLTDVQPAAAASYEVSPDGLTYTFHLQPRGTWSDGVPVRAQDFLAGWRRVLDPRVNSPVAELLAGTVKNAAGYDSLDPTSDAGKIPAFLDQLGLQAPDDHTFVVTLDHPSFAFKWIAAVPALAPARADVTPGRPGPGNGPFQLESAAADKIVLTANSHYWAGRPHLDEIVLVPQGDPAADLNRYRGGSEEITTVATASEPDVSRDGALAQQLVQVPELGEVFAQFNVHSAPFDNAGVRLAFAQAIDRGQLLAQLAEPALASVGPVPKGLRDYRADLAAQRFDPATARATLASSGVSPVALQGIKLLVRDLPADRALAGFIAGQLKQNLGVDIALDVHPSPDVTTTLQTGRFQFQAPAGWLADYADAQDFLDIYRTEDFSQWSRYSNPAYDHLVGEADASSDPTRRLQLYAQAQQLMAGEAPVAFLYQPLGWNLKQPYVQGVTYTALDDWPGDLYAADIVISAH
ncbi:MAG TPA: peptide ABC transporter substrate-binding protein [Candidatus Dormibacteraeota bacterium]|nr:peptide ABC transporter substrate-binding protein [Candidatus Dormibacteraeota bacterium]